MMTCVKFEFFSLSDGEYNQLIGNIEDLIEAHRRLNSGLEDVRRSQPRQQRLGQVFLQHGAGVRAAHLEYWANHPRSVFSCYVG